MNDMTEPCWICGADATTGEHSQKKTDITAMFGSKSFSNVVKRDYDKNKKTIIQGPNSRALKYDNNLCERCNSATTQPFDLAYTIFAEYVRYNFVELSHTSIVNTNIVFGNGAARRERRNLFLYFIKAFGCKLNDRNLVVPQVLRDALLGKNYDTSFRVSICLNQAPQPFLKNFPLEGNQDDQQQPVDFFWAQDNGWFTVVHAYKRPISPEFGEEWFGKSRSFRVSRWSASIPAFERDCPEARRPLASRYAL
jgi:hypothetical protein